MEGLDQLRYPIGKFVKGNSYSLQDTKRNIEIFSALPNQLESFVKDWTERELSTVYRDGGWTGRQVINHLGDSHAQLPLRFKSCLTEQEPQIRPYNENLWAQLQDGANSDIKFSLMMLHGLHGRLVELFKSLTEADWQKTIYHPESKHMFTLAELLALYTWHGQHHLGHLKIIANKTSSNS